MKKYGFIFVLLTLVAVPLASVKATSGACSGHGGVDCSAGASSDGSVICNDGWTGSSVSYDSMVECGGGYDTTPDCPLMSTYDYTTGSCTCMSGYVADGSTCISEDESCENQIGFMSDYDVLTGNCECMSGYVLDGGQCEDDTDLYTAPTAPPIDDTNSSNPSINITTTSIPDGVLNQSYSADITVNYIGSYPTITFSGLPTGSTSSGFIQGGGIQANDTYANVSDTGGTVIAHLTGTPVVAGQYSVVMSVTEGTISQSQSFSLNIANPSTVVQQNTTTNTASVSPIVASPTVIPTQTSVQIPAKQPAPIKAGAKVAVAMPTIAPSTTPTQMTSVSFTPTTQAVQQPVSEPKPSVIQKVLTAIGSFFKHLF